MKKQELQIATQKYKNCVDAKRHPDVSGDVVVVSLDGFIDGYSCAKLKQTFDRLIKQRIYKFIVDLSQIDYLSSHGVHIFINVFWLTQEKKGNIILVNPKPNVREVFASLGLTQIFTITNEVTARNLLKAKL